MRHVLNDQTAETQKPRIAEVSIALNAESYTHKQGKANKPEGSHYGHAVPSLDCSSVYILHNKQAAQGSVICDL